MEKAYQQNNLQKHRTYSTKLLSILSKRERQATIKQSNDWPGLRKPNFAQFSTYKLKSRQVAISRNTKKPTTSEKQQYIKPIPIIENSSKSLSLYPSRGRTPYVTVKDSRITHNQLNQNNERADHIFETKMTDKKMYNTNWEKFKHKPSSNQLSLPNTNQAHDEQELRKKRLRDYVIDFEAFNYISKIIDIQNAQTWSKFVHKRNVFNK